MDKRKRLFEIQMLHLRNLQKIHLGITKVHLSHRAVLLQQKKGLPKF